ncbi:hypothetical protein [Streptomyces sp. SYSU K21746]
MLLVVWPRPGRHPVGHARLAGEVRDDRNVFGGDGESGDGGDVLLSPVQRAADAAADVEEAGGRGGVDAPGAAAWSTIASWEATMRRVRTRCETVVFGVAPGFPAS